MSWHKIADIFTWLRRKFTLGHFASTSTLGQQLSCSPLPLDR